MDGAVHFNIQKTKFVKDVFGFGISGDKLEHLWWIKIIIHIGTNDVSAKEKRKVIAGGGTENICQYPYGES